MAKRNAKGRWKPGESGNPNGRPPKGYSITEMMREMLSNDPEVKEKLGNVIITKALEGDITAIKTVWQYMDGMPSQNLDVTSKGEKISLSDDEIKKIDKLFEINEQNQSNN